MNFIVDTLGRFGLLRRDLDYDLLRAAMVIIFAWFGWNKWHLEEIQQIVPLPPTAATRPLGRRAPPAFRGR